MQRIAKITWNCKGGCIKIAKQKKCENVIALEKLVVGGDEDLKEKWNFEIKNQWKKFN